MRAILVLVAAVMFGLAGGFAWSAMARHPAHAHVPKAPKAARIVVPETPVDRQWAARADDSDGAAAAVASNVAQDAAP